MSLSIVPVEVLNQHILHHLPTSSTYVLGRTSTIVRQMILNCAHYPQPDIDCSGKLVSITFDKNQRTISTLLLQKFKVEMFTLRDMKCSQAVTSVLCDHTHQMQARGEYGLQEALIDGLGGYGGYRRPYPDQFMFLILSHPSAKFIPKEGCYRLGRVLPLALQNKKPEVFKALLTHPHAKYVSATDLGECLQRVNDEESLKLLFSHPNSKNLPADGDDSLVSALNIFSKSHPTLAKMVLFHPNALNIKEFTLARMSAGQCQHTELVQHIEGVVQAVYLLEKFSEKMSDKESEIFEKLKEMLSTDNIAEFFDTFNLLSANTKHCIFEVLCRRYLKGTRDIDKDGLVCLQENPSLLLPIINKLLS